MDKYVYLGFLLCFCLQTSWAFSESDLDQTDLKCLEELKYDKSVVLNSYDKNDVIVEGNEKMNTFFECAWKKDGLMAADGTIDSDKLEKMVVLKLEKLFPDDKKYQNHLAKESVKACRDTKGTNNGDKCVKMYNCLLAQVGEISAKVKPGDIK